MEVPFKGLKRGMCIKFESLKICMAGNQCDNSDLDIHNADAMKDETIVNN